MALLLIVKKEVISPGGRDPNFTYGEIQAIVAAFLLIVCFLGKSIVARFVALSDLFCFSDHWLFDSAPKISPAVFALPAFGAGRGRRGKYPERRIL